MPLTSGRDRFGDLVRTLLEDTGRHSLLLDRRRRRHLAVLSAILTVSVFGYLLLQPRQVRVQADGHQLDVDTLISNDHALLRSAGVRLRPGDRVTLLDGRGIDVLRVDRARAVTLHADGMTLELLTHAMTIDQLLSEADVAITGRDSVLQNGVLVSMNAPVDPPRLFATLALFGQSNVPASAGVVIDVRRAVPFTTVEDGKESPSTSSRPTVAQALREAGMVVGPGDAVSPPLQSPLNADTRIEVRHARAVTIALPEGHETLYTLASTVGEVLEEANITLPDGAFVDPSVDTPISGGMSVRVVQLSAGSDIERESIESRTLYKSDESLPPGEIRTIRGHDGALVRRYEVSYVDGEEAGRVLTEEYYDPEPADTVIYYPTRTGRNDAQPSASGSVQKTLRVYATYYTPASSGRDASDPAYGVTASGRVVTYGIVAVDPDVIPLGTRMFIPGYGYAIAADTGGAVQGYIVDLGFPDGVAIDWQPKWLDIYVLS